VVLAAVQVEVELQREAEIPAETVAEGEVQAVQAGLLLSMQEILLLVQVLLSWRLVELVRMAVQEIMVKVEMVLEAVAEAEVLVEMAGRLSWFITQ
jgi:hypothetical protein